MATKKTSTAVPKQEKQYLVIDHDGDILGYGTMSEITESLEMYNDGDDEHDEIKFPEWIAQCTIYELGVGKKLQYTPSKFEMK